MMEYFVFLTCRGLGYMVVYVFSGNLVVYILTSIDDLMLSLCYTMYIKS
jgi:hypothetical protein